MVAAVSIRACSAAPAKARSRTSTSRHTTGMGDTMFDQLTEQQLRGRKTINWNHFGPDVLPLWIGEGDFPTSPGVVDGIPGAGTAEEFGYPAFREDTLARATADWCRRRYGWRVAPEWIRVVPDVLKGIELVIKFLTRPESPVVLP